MDKKTEMLNGPKPSNIQHNQTSSPGSVNSINNNNSVSNSNRKSSETVTSSLEKHSDLSVQSPIETANEALADILGEESLVDEETVQPDVPHLPSIGCVANVNITEDPVEIGDECKVQAKKVCYIRVASTYLTYFIFSRLLIMKLVIQMTMTIQMFQYIKKPVWHNLCSNHL